MADDLERTGVELVAEGGDEFESALNQGAEATGAFESAVGLAAAGMSGGSTIITGALLHIGEIAVDSMMQAGQAVARFP